MLIAVRDPTGNRPLSIGKLNGGYCISSETIALSGVSAEHVMDVEPGTMIFLTKHGVNTIRFAVSEEKKCRFEGSYFSHPGSTTFGESVSDFRMRLGEALEAYAPVIGADIVTPVPDSANFIAMGFAQSGRSGVFRPVIYRSHYVGRTFIAATQAHRDEEVSQKFGFDRTAIKGKSIVVIDDSIVRGTTLPKIMEKLWQLGAKEVHVRIGTPPIMHPCRYGINTPDKNKLISSRLHTDELCKQMGATSLAFIPLDIMKTLSPNPESFCWSCMDGKYW